MTVILMLRTMYDGRRYRMQHDLLRDFPKLCVTAYTMLENSRLQRIWGLILVSGPRKKETPSETISYVSSEVDEKES